MAPILSINDPEEIPADPSNRFLMRSVTTDKEKEESKEKDKKKRKRSQDGQDSGKESGDEKEGEEKPSRDWDNNRSRFSNPSAQEEKKIKGRGRIVSLNLI